MAQQQIITKPYVGELQNGDSLFINHDGALRQVSVPNADLARHSEIEAETAAREEFEAQEVAAREAFEESETEAREEFEADVQEQMAEKANVDGYYEEMTVGDAEQLVATQFVEDNEPYLFRSTGGSADVGNRAYLDEIIGGTVAWNQLVQNGNFADSSGWAVSRFGLSVANNVATLTALSTVAQSGAIYRNISVPAVVGHKYLYSLNITPSKATTVRVVYDGYGIVGDTNITTGANVLQGVASPTSVNHSGYLYVYPNRGGAFVEGDTVALKDFWIVDLTAMFGSTIADYIYSLEQANAGAGVAWFRKLFPADYYEYNAGELISVEGLESHDTVGFNQLDEEFELGSIGDSGENVTSGQSLRTKNYIPVIPNTSYYIEWIGHKSDGSTQLRLYYYDSEEQYISKTSWFNFATATTPDNARYIRLKMGGGYGTTYNHDICINLSWSGYRNGEYEEYVKHSYLLDNSLTLRGIPKLDASNNLYYDGDTYEPDGTVTRKYGIVDLGTLNWTWSESYSTWNVTASAIPIKTEGYAQNLLPPMVCEKYTPMAMSYALNNDVYNCISYNPSYGNVFVKMQNNSVTPTGYLVYELATPTTEEAEPYQQIQIVDDFGTEEFVSNSIVPVGHMTEYPANLRDKLQHLPDLASMDGTYIIQQTGKQMSLVYMPAVFPEIPNEDGTYTLKTVVASGVATLQWVAD